MGVKRSFVTNIGNMKLITVQIITGRMPKYQFVHSVINLVFRFFLYSMLTNLNVKKFDLIVPSSRSVVPDIAVSAHIDRDCKSDPAVRKRERCSFPKCKQKELIKILCEDCRQNFCLKHRHKEVLIFFLANQNGRFLNARFLQDHKCVGFGSRVKGNTSQAGLAAMQRLHQTPTAQAKRPQERSRR